eukprot:m.334917 g.334917  ORF g.334917 m.334917 type:complete len:199 (-) comp17464_c0_seq1:74-670(-)
MVKIFCIAILHKNGGSAGHVAISKDLSTFGFFQRSTASEFMTFFSKTLAERTSNGTRHSVKEENYVCHAHTRSDDLCGVVIADDDYPHRVAFSLISKVLEEFAQLYPSSTWTGNTADTPYPKLEEHIKKYQNPDEADAMSRIHKDLDETKIILHKNMEDLLNRGEKLDDLVSKSEGLSSSAKMFYKQAKKTNQCCIVM